MDTKRFTETDKWKDPWFRKLSPRLKCLWQYVCDYCCPAGTFDLDWELASFIIGEPVSEKDLEFFEDRITRLPNGKHLIVKFIVFQYGTLSKDCPAHVRIFKALDTHSIPYPYPSSRVVDTLEDKKGKEEDRKGGIVKGGEIKESQKELPPHLNTARMQNKWTVWQTHRRGLKKPKNWLLLFNEQVEWLTKFDEATAFEILSASIRNGYTGLFEPKDYGKRTSTPKENPRNIGITRGPTDYAAAARRLADRCAEDPTAGVAVKVAQNGSEPSPVNCSRERSAQLLQELRQAAESGQPPDYSR